MADCHPKRLIFAPGDLSTGTSKADKRLNKGGQGSGSDDKSPVPPSRNPTPAANASALAHAHRAHQFTTNPPLTFAQLNPTNPLHQFTAWFADPRLTPGSAPETAVLATACLDGEAGEGGRSDYGRVSARVAYIKELDERGWVVYSNWGSGEGKGRDVFGLMGDCESSGAAAPADVKVDVGVPGSHTGAAAAGDASHPDGISITHGHKKDGLIHGLQGPGVRDSGFAAARAAVDETAPKLAAAVPTKTTPNSWAALTFNFPTVERQVRVEGVVEPVTSRDSIAYWRTRARGSRVGAWASAQSAVLWEVGPAEASRVGEEMRRAAADVEQTSAGTRAGDGAAPSSQRSQQQQHPGSALVDDGRAALEARVTAATARYGVADDDADDVPLPPFWGGVRVVPESVEFWQGRASRLHDRFRYVRDHKAEADARAEAKAGDGEFKWRVQRLSP